MIQWNQSEYDTMKQLRDKNYTAPDFTNNLRQVNVYCFNFAHKK